MLPLHGKFFCYSLVNKSTACIYADLFQSAPAVSIKIEEN